MSNCKIQIIEKKFEKFINFLKFLRLIYRKEFTNLE